MPLGRLVLLGLGTGSAAFIGFKTATEDGFDIHNVGAARFGRAAMTVGRIGVAYKQTLGKREKLDGDEYNHILSETHTACAERLLKLCHDNGGCFTKVGQHIGALDYLLPSEYVDTMKVLHSRAPEMKLKDIYRVIEDDVGRHPNEIFSEFDEKPLGTASLAQVHRAVMKEDGQEVAVKVQHRYVRNHSFIDIHTMDFLVHTIKFFFPQFEFMWLAEQMRKNLPLELSFEQEARNAEKVATLFTASWLKIPKIHWNVTTDRVLVMEYCEGAHINDVDALKRNGVNLKAVSRHISEMYADMIFHFGYVHCDPHPGNVLVRKTSDGQDQIILLDHGLYSQLTNEFRMNYSQFWLSILKADLNGIQEFADKLGVGELYGLFACMVAGRSWDSISKGLDKAGEKSPEEKQEIKDNVARYIKEIADVLAYVNQEMILIFKTNDLLRTIEYNLGTQNSMESFVQMSRACLRSINGERLRKANGFWPTLKWTFIGHWDQIKITFYQMFLWLYWTPLFRFSRRMMFS